MIKSGALLIKKSDYVCFRVEHRTLLLFSYLICRNIQDSFAESVITDELPNSFKRIEKQPTHTTAHFKWSLKEFNAAHG